MQLSPARRFDQLDLGDESLRGDLRVFPLERSGTEQIGNLRIRRSEARRFGHLDIRNIENSKIRNNSVDLNIRGFEYSQVWKLE